MKRKALQRLLVLTVLVMALVGLNAHPAVAEDKDDDQRPLIAPIQTRPEGQTYGRWAAEWWQWALGIPAAVNPLTDTTGEHCAQRQVDQVWFLAGSIVGPVVRTCEVPSGKSLFFPLINNIYGAFLNDEPPETRTEEFVRAAASCTEPTQISVRIDGFTSLGRSGSLRGLRAASRRSLTCSCPRRMCSEQFQSRPVHHPRNPSCAS